MPNATLRPYDELRNAEAGERVLATCRARHVERLLERDHETLLRAMEVAALQSLARACAGLGQSLCVGQGRPT
jgi:hypothetical protein